MSIEEHAERIGQAWFTGGREKAAEVLREVMGTQVSANPFVPVRGQSFSCQQDWINRASRALTCHPEYRNTEHGDGKGWQEWMRRQSRKEERAALAEVSAATEHRTIEFDGVKLVQNTTLDRIQLLFDDKPDAETIAHLKKSAFRWSPREGAWQRQNTNNGVQAAYRILRALGHGKDAA